MKTILVSLWCLIIIFSSCNGGTKTERVSTDSSATDKNSEERNKMEAIQLIKAINENNVDEAFKNTAVDVVEYGDGSMPPTKGLDSLKMNLKMWLNNIENYKGENLDAVAEGNKVMVYGDWSGQFKSDFMGMKAAGKKFKMKDVDYFTFNDEGKITEHRSVQSITSMLASSVQAK